MKKILPAILVLCINQLMAQQPAVVLPLGHTATVNTIAFSSDGRKIATGSDDNTIKIWETQTGLLLNTIHVPYQPGNASFENVMYLRFTKDGRQVISTHRMSDIKVWDTEKGKLVASFPLTQGLQSLPDPGSDRMALIPFNYYDEPTGTIQIVNINRGDTLASIENPFSNNYYELPARLSIAGLEWSPGGKLLLQVTASASKNKHTCYAWNTSTGKLALQFPLEADNPAADDNSSDFPPLTQISFNPAGNMVAFLSDDDSGTVRVNNLDTGGLIRTIRFGKKIQFITWKDNNRLIYGYDGSMLLGYDAETGKLTNFNKTFARRAGWTPDGFVTADQPVSINANDEMHQWMTVADNQLSGTTIPVAYSPDGRIIATAYLHNTIQLWDAVHKTKLVSLKNFMTAMQFPVYSNDGKTIATIHNDNSIRLWNTESSAYTGAFTGHNEPVNAAAFSHDNKKLATASADKTVRIWDISTGKTIATLTGFTEAVSTVQWSPDDKLLLITAETPMQFDADMNSVYKPYPQNIIARIYNTATGKIVFEKKGSFALAALNAGGNKLATVTGSLAQLWDTQTGQLTATLKGHTSDISYLSFSPDGSKLATGSVGRSGFRDWTGTYLVWDATTGKRIGGGGEVQGGNRPEWSSDSKKIAYVLNGSNLVGQDLQTGKAFKLFFNEVKGYNAALNIGGDFTYENNTNQVVSFAFHPDGKRVVVSYENNSARIWDLETKTVLKELQGYSGINFNAAFSPDGKRTITTSQQGLASIWDTDSGKLLYSFYAGDSAAWFIFTPANYYHASPGTARSLHYTTNDLSAVGFEQLDTRYHRPDKVMEAAGSQDTALISAYRNAYYKRISKLAVDTTAFNNATSVPEADFANRFETNFEQSGSSLTLHLKGSDKDYPLKQFNILVNEVPVFGVKGVPLTGKRKTIDTSITITLSTGKNRIEAILVNANGIASFRKPMYVTCTPAEPAVPKTYFIGIGIARFRQQEHNLSFSVKDIRDLAAALQAKNRNIIIDTLFDEQVTKENITALKNKLQAAGENDKVILVFSGHGLMDRNYDYFLSTYNIDFADPAAAGLPYDALEGLLNETRSRQKLLLIDACRSGELDKEEKIVRPGIADTAKQNGVSSKGGIVENNSSPAQITGRKTSFELMQELFGNTGRGTGATVITASTGWQDAQERYSLNNGVFTYAIIETIRNNSSLPLSLLKNNIISRVRSITNDTQKPTVRNELQEYDWELW